MRGYSEEAVQRAMSAQVQQALQHLRNHGVRVRVPRISTIQRWSITTLTKVRLWIEKPQTHEQPRQVRMTHWTDKR